MGRVARYKKVKASYTKNAAGGGDFMNTVGVWGLGDSGRKPKKRSKTSEKLRAQRKKGKKKHHHDDDIFDVGVEGGDDFDLADMVGSLKKQKPEFIGELKEDEKHSRSSLSPAPPTSLVDSSSTETKSATKIETKKKKESQEDEKEEKKLLKKIEQQVESRTTTATANQIVEGRMPGESKRAYNKRVKLETRQIIQKSNRQQHNPEKRQKKKDFLNNKKANKKKNKRKRTYNSDDDDDNYTNTNDDDFRQQQDGNDSSGTTLLTGEQALAMRAAQTKVQFGEQAERPPIFQQLPRGAQPKKSHSYSKSNKKKRASATEDEQAMQAEMDLMRRKVQAQYAAIKSRRRQAGDFHL